MMIDFLIKALSYILEHDLILYFAVFFAALFYLWFVIRFIKSCNSIKKNLPRPNEIIIKIIRDNDGDTETPELNSEPAEAKSES